MGNIEQSIKWFQHRQGRVGYSMTARNGPNYYDCSSAVFYALKAGGFPIPYVGNTETLFSMEGNLLLPINRSQVRRGDIFVSGRKGGSANAYGHTGMAISTTQIIHCSSRFNGIGVSGIDTGYAYSGAPMYWYRVAGQADTANAVDTVDKDTKVSKEIQKIYITDVNGGKDYLVNEKLAKIFGKKVEVRTYDNVLDANDLKTRAIEDMNNDTYEVQSLKLTFSQLGYFDNVHEKLKYGDIVRVVNPELNIDTRMRVEAITFNVNNPEIGDIELGQPSATMTRLFVDRDEGGRR